MGDCWGFVGEIFFSTSFGALCMMVNQGSVCEKAKNEESH